MQICPSCGQENPEIARFCLACGAALTSTRAGEERRIVTVLFADLVGFTSRAETLDPEDVRAILAPYHARLRHELERFGGTVEKFVGDAVMAVFGAPVAYGDDPERAVRAALAIREWAREQEDLQVRIAVNTGEALVTLGARPAEGEGMVAGDVVNTAARLQTAAPVNEILVGEETHAATRTAVDYRQAPPVEAKGKTAPVPVWLAVEAKAPAGERALSRVPMVGRERELDVLRGIWERVAEERRPHLVTLFGPAGIGKSRLTAEFGEIVTDLGGQTIRGRSTPYGASTPYAAFSTQVKQVAGIFDSDPAATAYEKLRAAVADATGGGDEELTSHLAILVELGTDAEAADRDTLFYAARVLVESLAARQPTLLVFEDIHWAEASLLDLLEALAAHVRDAPVLMLALARPELLTSRPTWGGGLPAYTALPLEPLGDDASRELASRLLEGAGRAEEAPLLAEKAEGNPLFIEELAASLAERDGGAGELPTSIRAIVAARFDALPPEERATLLDAAAVGRVFWRGALARISEREDLPALLGSLERRDFIRREPVSRIQGDQQFSFKHALIRDVAYQALPRAARRERHAAVAEFLEETTAEAPASAEALAYHWREGGNSERAVDHLLAAAEQAGRGWAKEHAVALFRQALGLVGEESPRRRSVQLKLAVALQAAYHVPDAERLRRP